MYRTRPTFVPTRLLNAVTLAFVTSALVPFTPALAACNITSPASGQTATCDTSAPNPANTPVSAVPGSTNVTVNVLPDAELDVSGATGIAVSD
ncbi:hypothetical protein [Paraburkholderia gardini]|uniref:Uncharacterized protein n=1 Tax=Paraburkholderia gardini TaxID=2823469 RepID=A0ABN7QNW2_9BURK|nr:hypothetical protein [Paraburkholderia gardini]CAG4914408.1 hypothetical protein R54767_04097 [Paraburkholderia gardini]